MNYIEGLDEELISYTPPGKNVGASKYKEVCGCYVIEHVKTGMVYVGSTRDLARRVRTQLTTMPSGEHYNKGVRETCGLHDELKAYIVITTDRDTAYSVEQRIVDIFVPLGLTFNIGVDDVRRPTLGVSPSIETRIKRGLAGIGKTHSEETKEKMRAWNIGRKHTPETRTKLSEIRKALWSDAAFVQQSPLAAHSKRCCMPVRAGEITYQSITAAAVAFKLNESTIAKRCRSNKYPDFNFA